MSIHSSVHLSLSHSVSQSPTVLMPVKFDNGDFYDNLSKATDLVKIGLKYYALYVIPNLVMLLLVAVNCHKCAHVD